MSYAKLHTSLLTSSLWTEDTETRIVWITLLCLADKHGEVQASIPGLAKVAGVSLEACEKAIAKFLSPDKYSRSRVMEGRRLQEIDGGWEIITYAKHRAMASKEDEKEKAAERQQRFRERNALVTPSNGESQQVTPSNAPSRPVTENRDIADADADADADAKANSKNNKKRFKEPSIEEVKIRCAEIGLADSDAERFWNYHAAKGWVVGNQPMKSWVAALNTWKLNGQKFNQGVRKAKPTRADGEFCPGWQDKDQREMTANEIVAQAGGL